MARSYQERTRERALEWRRLRGRSEPFTIVPVRHPHPGALDAPTFDVTTEAGRRYAVRILDWTGRRYHCSCPDFQKNGLGTCKHVEAVLWRLETGALTLSPAGEADTAAERPNTAAGAAGVRGPTPDRPDLCFFNLETQYTFDEVGGRQHFDRLRLAIAVVYSSREGRYLVYREEEADALVRRLMAANLVVGYNLLGFDYPVLAPYGGELLSLTPTLDMLVEVQRVLGFRIGLDAIARATLGTGKSGDGLQAVRWFREGKVEQVIAYCRDDVEVTKGIFLHGLRHGRLQYVDREGAVRSFPVWWGGDQVGRLARAAGME